MDSAALRAAGVEVEVIEAKGRLVTPGLIDPHEHLIGAGGEEGFATRITEVDFSELVKAGITTVVGCIGTDTITRNLTDLLAKTRQLCEQGLSAYMLTGGFKLPSPTLTSCVMDDLVLIDKVIGVGEIALSDFRSVEPNTLELARVVSDAILGGLVGGKAGYTHFHVGPGKARLAPLHKLLDEHEIPPTHIYPTHVTRTRELLDDAVSLAKRGAFVDTDTIDEKLGEWLTYYLEKGGPAGQFTVSSDSHTPGGTPGKFYGQFVSCARDYKMPLERVLPHFTTNTAKVLKLPQKGSLQEGADADILVLEKGSLEIIHLVANGQQLLKDGWIVNRSEGK